jgi:aminotransferase
MTSHAHAAHRHVSHKASRFTESVIREMTREALKYGAVNLSQGFPDFGAPERIKRAAMEAIAGGINQYAITWGARDFREAIARKTSWYLGLDVDPEREITVTCGSTEAMIAAMMATVNPGDEVVIFEPFYENYAPDAILSDARPRYVPLRAPDWTFDPEELRAAFNERTKAIIICNPNNPTGKVFREEELRFIADLCIEHDALCFTDEIYEHIIYPREDKDIRHTSIATLDGMRERTVIVNSMSKDLFRHRLARRLLHRAARDYRRDSQSPRLPHRRSRRAAASRRSLRARLAARVLRRTANQIRRAPHTSLKHSRRGRVHNLRARRRLLHHDRHQRVRLPDDTEFTRHLIREIGVACVPGSSFYSDENRARLGGNQQVRFCFCKKDETLDAAANRLQKLKIMQNG